MSPSRLHSIWIILPAYNEGRQIAATLTSLQNKGYDNIIVVDDGSSDHTFEAARAMGVHVVQHSINLGAGAATSTGIEVALRNHADVIVTFDADGQHAPEDIFDVVKPILCGEADAVFGCRDYDKEMPKLRRYANIAGNILTWAISGLYVSDSQSGMKAFSRRAAAEIHISASGYEFCSEIFREIHYKQIRWKEVPIQAIYTDYSKSKGQSFARGIATASKLVVRSLLKAH